MTEGNVSMFNFDGTIGAVGRAAPYLGRLFNIALARFDIETKSPVRGSDGLCTRAAPGETGECLGQIRGDARASFTGYVDKSATGKKVLHDVFRPGDHWFATGDLIRKDKAGYFYFVDRVGDTFRWKGENVSTGEVSEQLRASPGVREAVVHGVRVETLKGEPAWPP